MQTLPPRAFDFELQVAPQLTNTKCQTEDIQESADAATDPLHVAMLDEDTQTEQPV